jgi:hypothetical protein
MTTEQHLSAIVAFCERNLALAAKRTPPPWPVEYLRRILRFADKNPMAAGVDNEESYDGLGMAPDADDAQFIAACAGAAEAGWRATISAIEVLRKTEYEFGPPDSVARVLCNKIIAAYPEELLS